jgi:hypothetical protein
VPGSEGDVRIKCELYKREVREGQETWLPADHWRLRRGMNRLL